MANRVLSPITSTENVELIESIKVDDIIESWHQTHGIDVSNYFSGHPWIGRYRCRDSQLIFFDPPNTLGDGDFYSLLQTYPWYYIEDKYEHWLAEKFIKPRSRVLEIGCGTGSFLSKLKANHSIVQGLEMNPGAIAQARERGIPVDSSSISDFARSHFEQFDVVCHFQVLEHIAYPIEFLTDCIRCMKPAGRLIIAVPNMDGFVGRARNNLLNQPPHHATQWSSHALKNLADVLPLRLLDYGVEPLSAIHAKDWAYTLTHEKFGWPKTTLIRKFVSLLALPVRWTVQNKAIRQHLMGHSQIVCFEKTETANI